MHDLSETIVAVATPPGRGGVACVRLSGPAAVGVAGELFRPVHGAIEADESRPVFGRFVGRDGGFVDHGYTVVFAAGASFTGELTAELWTHGSPAVRATSLTRLKKASGSRCSRSRRRRNSSSTISGGPSASRSWRLDGGTGGNC